MTDASGLPAAATPRASRVHRLRRLIKGNHEPHAVARGLAVGVFVAVSPFIGLQAVLALALALVFRLDKLATLAGAVLNPPWLWPFVYPTAYVLGGALLGHEGLAELPLDSVMEGGFPELVDFLLVHGAPLVLGTTVLGAIAGLLTYGLALSWIRRARRSS